MRKVVTLKFPTKAILWKFWNETPGSTHSVELAQGLITQSLSEEEIAMALTKYSATIVQYGNEQTV